MDYSIISLGEVTRGKINGSSGLFSYCRVIQDLENHGCLPNWFLETGSLLTKYQSIPLITDRK